MNWRSLRICLPAVLCIFAAGAFAVRAEDRSTSTKDDKTRSAVTSNHGQPTRNAHAPAEKTASDALNKSKTDNENADLKAIRTTGTAFVNAFNERDLNLISAFFTEDAEYCDIEGNVYEGRKEIEDVFKSTFEEFPDAKIRMQIDRIRRIGPGVAIEDGKTIIEPSGEKERTETRYSAVHVKHGDQWLVASVRERSSAKTESHRVQLQQLNWLNGNWVDESDGAVVIFSCSPVDEGNYLLRKFSIHIAGEPALTGEQRIGWDPLNRKLRTWIFDSQGGYAEGFWFHNDDRWILKTHGITGTGETASATTIYQPIDENTMTWQAIDHEVGGVPLPDSEPITIVRRSPVPENEEGDVASLPPDSK